MSSIAGMMDAHHIHHITQHNALRQLIKGSIAGMRDAHHIQHIRPHNAMRQLIKRSDLNEEKTIFLKYILCIDKAFYQIKYGRISQYVK